MGRKPRFCLPNVPQHVIQRGNDRKPCFFAGGDYRMYLDYLTEAAERYECRLHAYVLMTNHVHLLVTPMAKHGVAHRMQRLGQRYVQSLNALYRRSGTLWEGRYNEGKWGQSTFFPNIHFYSIPDGTRIGSFASAKKQ